MNWMGTSAAQCPLGKSHVRRLIRPNQRTKSLWTLVLLCFGVHALTNWFNRFGGQSRKKKFDRWQTLVLEKDWKKERNWPVCRSFGASIERAALDSSSSSYFGTVWEICQWHMRKCRHVPIIDGAQHTVLQYPARYSQCSSPSNTIGPVLAVHTNTMLFVWPLIDVFSLFPKHLHVNRSAAGNDGGVWKSTHTVRHHRSATMNWIDINNGSGGCLKTHKNSDAEFTQFSWRTNWTNQQTSSMQTNQYTSLVTMETLWVNPAKSVAFRRPTLLEFHLTDRNEEKRVEKTKWESGHTRFMQNTCDM